MLVQPTRDLPSTSPPLRKGDHVLWSDVARFAVLLNIVGSQSGSPLQHVLPYNDSHHRSEPSLSKRIPPSPPCRTSKGTHCRMHGAASAGQFGWDHNPIVPTLAPASVLTASQSVSCTSFGPSAGHLRPPKFGSTRIGLALIFDLGLAGAGFFSFLCGRDSDGGSGEQSAGIALPESVAGSGVIAHLGAALFLIGGRELL